MTFQPLTFDSITPKTLLCSKTGENDLGLLPTLPKGTLSHIAFRSQPPCAPNCTAPQLPPTSSASHPPCLPSPCTSPLHLTPLGPWRLSRTWRVPRCGGRVPCRGRARCSGRVVRRGREARRGLGSCSPLASARRTTADATAGVHSYLVSSCFVISAALTPLSAALTPPVRCSYPPVRCSYPPQGAASQPPRPPAVAKTGIGVPPSFHA